MRGPSIGALAVVAAGAIAPAPALPAEGDRVCPSSDPAECYKSCFTGGDEGDRLAVALEANPRNGWKQLHEHFQRWRWCMDGSASETYSGIVRSLLARNWAGVAALFDIAARDPSFFNFVEKRIQAVEPWLAGDRVSQLAATKCAPRDVKLCERIATAAKTATEGLIEITPQRIGPLSGTVVPTTETLGRLFPAARIERFETEGIGGFKDGGEGWRIWLDEDEMAMFVLSDPKRRSFVVSVVGPTPVTSLGLRVGSRVDDLVAKGPVRCRLDPEEEGWALACARPIEPNIEYVFRPTVAELANGDARGGLPKAFVPERGDRAIEGIGWTPPEPRSR